jgi:hypothetical protein
VIDQTEIVTTEKVVLERDRVDVLSLFLAVQQPSPVAPVMAMRFSLGGRLPPYDLITTLRVLLI